MATQILAIFVIRTRRFAPASVPHPALTVSSLAALAVALVLPFTVPGHWLGFAMLPVQLSLAIVVIVAAYLLCAEVVKRWARPRP